MRFCFSFCIVAVFMLCASPSFSQPTSSQQHNFIVELETAQSKQTGTFVSCSMKRPAHIKTQNEEILIHRSTNKTASWQLIKTLTPPNKSRYIDPVLTVDATGIFYLVFMNIIDASLPIQSRKTSLDLYRSTDDGKSWTFIGNPHVDKFPDYPQLISGGSGKLCLTFGNSTTLHHQEILFIQSKDSGKTWTKPIAFNKAGEITPSTGIPDLNWGRDSSIQLSFGSAQYKGPCMVKSKDFGNTWGNYSFANQNNTSATVAVLSKVISNPKVDFSGLLSHQPHRLGTPITYHFNHWDSLGTTFIDSGAYAEGMLTNDSLIHIIYNQMKDDTFRVKYIVSGNQGLSFTKPVVLYSAPFQIQELGEYQSLVLGKDSLFYLTFCDWGDSSKAKSLVFAPQHLAYNPILKENKSTSTQQGTYALFPNPSSGQISLDIPDPKALQNIIITNLTGKELKTIAPPYEQASLKLNLTDFKNGMYLIRFTEKERYVVRRFVIKK